MKTKLEQLREMTAIQCTGGNWNFDPYMHGMANGMIFALALMEEKEPKFLAAPKKWLGGTPIGDVDEIAVVKSNEFRTNS